MSVSSIARWDLDTKGDKIASIIDTFEKKDATDKAWFVSKCFLGLFAFCGGIFFVISSVILPFALFF